MSSYIWLMSPTAAYAGEHEHFSEACIQAVCNHTNEKFMSSHASLGCQCCQEVHCSKYHTAQEILNLHILITDRQLKTASTDVPKRACNTVRKPNILWNPQDTVCIIYEHHETAVCL